MTEPSSAILSPLSRFYQTADYDHLTPELAVVDARWDASQHPVRRWEYAMALHALHDVGPWGRPTIYDVGGYGSPFFRMVADQTGNYPTIIDPKASTGDLASYLGKWPRPRLADAITCLSVLEHVPNETAFLYHLSCLLAPGGVLVLTVDAVDTEPEQDRYHFHWLRERIYTPSRIQAVVETLRPLRITPREPPDFRAFSPLDNWGYSCFSVVCHKAG